MSLTFTKLFSSITESTVWFEPNETRIVWITMLAMADRKGRVFASIPGLAHRARVTTDECRTAIDTFLAPDKDSRTKEFDGRRIAEIDGGWKLLNHEKYRQIRDEEAIKESKRKYAARKRSEVEKVERDRHNAEAEAEAEAEADNDPPKSPKGKTQRRPSKAKKEEDQTLSSMKTTVIEKYNEVAKKRDWFLVDPEKRLPKATDDLMTKFLEKPEHFAQLDTYMEKLSCLDWVEAARIDFTLRTRTFNEVMSGKWVPREKQTNGRHPPEEEESPEMRSARLEYEASVKKGSA